MAVCVAAIAYAIHFDCVLPLKIKEDSEVSASQAKAGERWLQFLYVSASVSQVAADAVENLHCGFPFDRA